MLLTSGTHMQVSYKVIQEDEISGKVKWEAFYTFSRSGRKVHNKITSTFTFKDDLILRQTDVFDFWKWSRQALATPGLLLGWSHIIKNKVQGTAAKNLAKAMAGSV